ncbi:MAG: PD-(D/E)XK nuclease family protein [Cyanobacteria bacterium J06627_28]
MTRFISTYPYPQQLAAQEASDRSYSVIAPSRLASRAIAASYQPLRDTAIKALEQQGWRMAQPLMAQKLFRQTVQAVLQPSDLIGTARALFPAVRSLLQSSQNLNSDLQGLSDRAGNLVTLAQQYREALRKGEFFDTGELYWRAAELEIKSQKILVYGYFQPQQDEIAWIDRLAADESIVFLPVDQTPLFADVQLSADCLSQIGWSIVPSSTATYEPTNATLCQTFLRPAPTRTKQLPIATDTVTACAYGTLDAEARGVLAQVKALLNEDIPAKEIAIIARDERAYGPKLIDIAWEYDLPIRALYSTPLLTTRLGTWIQLLLEVFEAGFPFEATAKLLSHPLCSNPDGGFWAIARAQHPKGFQQWRDIASQHLGLDLSVLAQINQTRRRDTWVGWWQRLFKTFDLRRRCARWARESIAFNTLQQGLVELSKPETEPLSWPSFREQLEDLLESLSVPAQPGRGGVELHSPASVVGTQYSHLFIMGMADSILPPPVSNDAVLDFFERRQLREQAIALPTASELFRQEALSFYYLLQATTGRITFSYPKLRERTEQLPSPYLKQLSLQVIAPPEQPIASLEEMRRYYLRHPEKSDEKEADTVLTQAAYAFEIEQHRESAQQANEYDGAISIPFDYSDWTFSVSQLTTLGQCQFKWFADKLLKLGSPVEVEEDLTPGVRGSLYHKVVEFVVHAVKTDSTKSISDANLLRESFLSAEKAVELPALQNWEVRREEHLRQLSITLNKPDFWKTEATPIALEKRFEGNWQGLKVTGRIDRIDETPNGLVLIDYKTGSSAPKGIKDSNDKASIDLQLPLYRDIAAELYPEQGVADTQYFSLTKGKKLSISRNAPQHELPTAIETCKTALHTGSYPVQPDVKREACKYCDFDLVCRQGSRLSRKEN